ncbi:MAG: hypothetical protein H7308_07545 [Chthonomonadaceae bacterium]|nr:hypothetical protein [Chthonomonadaceae bacterium]
MSDPLQNVLASLGESRKYRDLAPDLLSRIVTSELALSRSEKETIKAVKGALHQICGAYFGDAPPFSKWATALQESEKSEEELQIFALGAMKTHASTRERLPLLSTFYAHLLREISPIHSVLDLACGLNPLALSSMPLSPDCRYFATEIHGGLTDFLEIWFRANKIEGRAILQDSVIPPALPPVQIAFVQKFLPVVEQQRKGASLPFLMAIQAQFLLVTFPTKTLGGKSCGMAGNYSARFLELISEAPFDLIEQTRLDTELCFLLKRDGD